MVLLSMHVTGQRQGMEGGHGPPKMDDQMIQAFTIFVKYQKVPPEWFDAK